MAKLATDANLSGIVSKLALIIVLWAPATMISIVFVSLDHFLPSPRSRICGVEEVEINPSDLP